MIDPVPTPGSTQPASQPTGGDPGQPGAAPGQATIHDTGGVTDPNPPQPPVPPAPPPPQKGGIKEFFADLSLPDIVVGTLVVTSLALSVYYYRKKVRHIGREYPEIRADLDELKSNLRQLQGGA